MVSSGSHVGHGVTVSQLFVLEAAIYPAKKKLSPPLIRHYIPDPPPNGEFDTHKILPKKGFAEFHARIHTLGIGLSRSRAPLTRNFTCSTYGGITSINQRLHTVQTAGGSASSLPGHRPHAQNYREGGEHDFDHGCSSRVHRDDEQLRRHQRRVVPIALLPGSRLWREGRGGLRRGGGKL